MDVAREDMASYVTWKQFLELADDDRREEGEAIFRPSTFPGLGIPLRERWTIPPELR